jgi:hypothetical protein
MGYEFRGIQNDSIYCRPITKVGPVCIPYNGKNAQVFNLPDLLESKTMMEFWYRYGDISHHSDKYSPVRYHWLNLFPCCPNSSTCRGTVEFRIFNKTLNPYFIYSTLMFCKYILLFALSSSYSKLKNQQLLTENSVYNDYTTDDIVRLLIDFINRADFDIDSSIVNNLLTIINRTPIPNLSDDYVFSHIMYSRHDVNRYWADGGYTPPIILDSIRKPNYVDIHVLRGER